MIATGNVLVGLSGRYATNLGQLKMVENIYTYMNYGVGKETDVFLNSLNQYTRKHQQQNLLTGKDENTKGGRNVLQENNS